MKPIQIVELEKEIDILSQQLGEFQDELLNTQIKIIRKFLRYEETFVMHIHIGYHDCKDSPIGTCFYDSMEDPAFDDCLICGDPEERK